MTTVSARSLRPPARAWGQLVLNEARMVTRDTAGLVVPLGLPVLILVMNGLGDAVDARPPELGGWSVFDAFVLPITFALVIATIGVINMPSFLAMYRKEGVLRRLSATPAHPAMVLVAQVVVSALQTAVGIAIAVVIALLFFDMSLPGNLPAAVLVVALGAAAMYAIGMVVGAIAPTANSSVAIGLVLFFGMMALGGGFGPTENLPGALQAIGEHTPFGATVQALGAAWIGEGPATRDVAVLAGTTVVAGIAAAKAFRWD